MTCAWTYAACYIALVPHDPTPPFCAKRPPPRSAESGPYCLTNRQQPPPQLLSLALLEQSGSPTRAICPCGTLQLALHGIPRSAPPGVAPLCPKVSSAPLVPSGSTHLVAHVAPPHGAPPLCCAGTIRMPLRRVSLVSKWRGPPCLCPHTPVVPRNVTTYAPQQSSNLTRSEALCVLCNRSSTCHEHIFKGGRGPSRRQKKWHRIACSFVPSRSHLWGGPMETV